MMVWMDNIGTMSAAVSAEGPNAEGSVLVKLLLMLAGPAGHLLLMVV
jgi:hypothetical protein